MNTPRLASDVVARLAAAWIPNEGTQTPVHIPNRFAPSHLDRLSLPVGADRPPHQPVAFIDSNAPQGFHREITPDAIETADQNRGHTRVYESVDVRSDGWHSQVSTHLARILRRRIAVAVYESQTGDQSLGKHRDAWDGIILQLRGAKRWTLWPELQGTPKELSTHTGDILIIPQGMQHDVTTPPHPGHSLHITFAVTPTPLNTASHNATP
ncbi:cupin domain-containing protein [Streptomyces sp. NPDC047315]|uniref:JmjC domain-containing protein n=1 Tax=Streptomyces sp. NPDC047315 TaxID=3155142 RepID=UPI00340BEE8B